ncbi:sorbitol dehydrogenase [Aspergillus steynii IBT 23096]|uniref:Sorbitol dehydrogenase n=1 Tax=Aspergillus steynii IBT 23096 TaxID=1392250 RepID=A0A2I2G624_9EURO|nr:sorbitol dehydrogenase [Aspergillus steynii IBT 23096]PLB48336.1 sorbitol dehydrogenase [Aspergillus steynii IBT 23096]
MTSTTCEALVLHGAKDLRLGSKPVAQPAPSEVQVAIRATGLCGSDLHYYNHGRNGDFVVREPMCLGHESSGIVTAVAPDVTSLKVGDRVALEVGLPCRKCLLCQQGRYNICADMKFRSSAKIFPHLDGTLMELTTHPASMCHKLPDNVSFTGGALAEPLAVCLHAIRRSRPPSAADVKLAQELGDASGSSALIFGAGAVGLLLAAALAVSGPFTTIAIADIDASRLAIADSLNLGLRTTLIPKPSTPPPARDAPAAEQASYALSNAQSLAAALKTEHGVGAGFARVYDCTGVPACVQAGIYAAAPGSVLVQIGMGNPVQTVPVGAAALREVDIIGVFRYDGYAYPAAIELMASGRFDVVEEKVVTHRLGLKEGERAFGLAGKGVDEEGRPVVKVVIES